MVFGALGDPKSPLAVFAFAVLPTIIFVSALFAMLYHLGIMQRVIQAGAKPVTSLSVMLEWQRDWAERDTYDAVMDIVKNHYGAYGVGVEYAYTMVHGAPATKFPEYSIPALAMAHK